VRVENRDEKRGNDGIKVIRILRNSGVQLNFCICNKDAKIDANDYTSLSDILVDEKLNFGI